MKWSILLKITILQEIPKDKDNGLLVYNKEMFDAADVPYPTDDWTWEDLADASKKIHDETGKYGFMAYNDDQLGYWCFALLRASGLWTL